MMYNMMGKKSSTSILLDGQLRNVYGQWKTYKLSYPKSFSRHMISFIIRPKAILIS